MKRMKVRKSTADGMKSSHITKGNRRISVKTGRASAIVQMIKTGQVHFMNLSAIRRMLRNG